jgi:hypothetical protein
VKRGRLAFRTRFFSVLDARRIVASDGGGGSSTSVRVPGRVVRRVRCGGGRWRATSSGGQPESRFAPFDPVRDAEARTNHALLTQAHSSRPSVAMRPRVAACSPMSDAWWWATKAAAYKRERSSSPSGSAAPWLPQGWSSTDSAPSHRRAHRDLPSRSARALRRAEERRIVAMMREAECTGSVRSPLRIVRRGLPLGWSSNG